MRTGSVDEESTGRRPQPRAALPVLRSPPTRRARVRGRERSRRSRRPRAVAKRARSSPHLQRPGHVVSRLDRWSARIVARPHALDRLIVARRAVRQFDFAEDQVGATDRAETLPVALLPIGAAPRPRRSGAQLGQRFEVKGARLARPAPERQTWRLTTPPRSARGVDIRRRSRGAPMDSTTSSKGATSRCPRAGGASCVRSRAQLDASESDGGGGGPSPAEATAERRTARRGTRRARGARWVRTRGTRSTTRDRGARAIVRLARKVT